MTSLREKIIITIVFISVLIILVSVFFKKAHTEYQNLSIPKPDSISAEQVVSRLINVNQPLNLFEIPLKSTSVWVLQLVDFKEGSTPNTLVKTLRKKGYKAYTRKIELPTGPIIQIFVGPEIKSDKIETLKIRLSKEMRINATVTRFAPSL